MFPFKQQILIIVNTARARVVLKLAEDGNRKANNIWVILDMDTCKQEDSFFFLSSILLPFKNIDVHLTASININCIPRTGIIEE